MIAPPKINLLYYKHILDEAMERFASDFNKDFTKSKNSYVYSKNIGKKLLRIFREYVKEGILKHTEDFDISSPNYFFIISSCYPKDNVLKKYINVGKLTQEMNGLEKYTLSEEDIKIDDSLFNDVFEKICDEMIDRRKMKKIIGDRAKNTFFIRFDNLDCYFTYRMIRDIYGKTNTVNLFKNSGIRQNLKSINNIIDSEVKDIKKIIRSDEMKIMKCEIRQYVEMCMGGVI